MERIQEPLRPDATFAAGRDSVTMCDGEGRPNGSRRLTNRLSAPSGPALLGVPVLLWQVVFFAAPLIFLVVITFWQVKSFRLEPAFVTDNWTRVFSSTSFERALWNTLQLSLITTVLAVVLAFPAAYTIALRLSPRMRDLAIAALVVPVFSSYLLRIYAWQLVLSPEGLVNSLWTWVGGQVLPLLGGGLSLQIGLLTLTLPLAVIVLALALSSVEKSQLEAAENLGCTRFQVICHVLLPSIRPGLILAATTAFLLAFGDYVSPVFMTGSNPPTLSILVVDTVKSGSQWPRASVIGVSMLLLLTTIFLLGRLIPTGPSRKRWRS